MDNVSAGLTMSTHAMPTPSLCRPLTEDEVAIQGFEGNAAAPKLLPVLVSPQKGRGVISEQTIEKGA